MHVRTDRRARRHRGLAVAIASALTASAVGLSTPAVAHSGPTAAVPVQPASDSGLFGASDPTYDGVVRQSTALIGLYVVGADVPGEAIGWLLQQQCPDGSFAAYRADTTAPCPEPSPETFSGKDTNSTSMAAIALALLGYSERAEEAAAWLRDQQQPNGGWPWIPGGEVDTASTGWVVAALRTAAPRDSRSTIKPGLHFLRRSVIGCSADPDNRFGLPGYPTLNADTADVFGSSQGVIGITGRMPITPRRQQPGAPAVSCDSRDIVDSSLNALSRWAIRQIRVGGGAIPDPYSPGQSDWNATALATLGLIGARKGGRATAKAVRQLQRNVTEYTDSGNDLKPGAVGTLLQLAHATGRDPRDFGGVNLIALVRSSMRT